MPSSTKRLTVKQVENAKSSGLYFDGDGLYLQVTSNTAKSWLYRYTLRGKARWRGLGSAVIAKGGLTLEAARSARDQARLQVRAGIDPIEAEREQQQARKIEEAKAITFREAAVHTVAAQRPGWQNAKHAAQWETTLRAYAYPLIGDVPVAAVTPSMLVKVLQPLWGSKAATATRLRGRIEKVLDWAKAAGFREGENPARWRGNLDQLLANPARVRTIEHHAALPFSEMGSFMVDLRAADGVAARALEFTILNATRTTEALNATWGEIDTASKMWTIPASRMKGKREHRVPLSSAALALLERVRGLNMAGDYIFPNPQRGRPLSNMAMLAQLKRMGRNDLTVHGFRSTFRDWAAERTNFPNEVVEMALSHVIEDKTEAAYRRGDLLEKRRKLMEAWGAYCSGPSATAGKILQMRSTA